MLGIAVKRHSLAEWWQLIKSSVSAWSDDYAPSMGAALSYYSVFSMAPLLVIVIAIAGLVFGDEAARGQLFGQLSALLGPEAAKAIQDMLASLSKPSHGVTATIIGIGALLVGATSVFGELQDALDRIWRAPVRDKASGIWGLLRSRLLSFGMILGIAFLLMVSLVMSAAISALGKWWGGFFGSWEVLLQIVNFVVGFVMTTAVFAMIYKLMPRVQVRWHDVWLGAGITALLFTVGRFLIGLYLGKSGIASGFGAAGSIAIVFVWVYYSAQIFLLGAEFTWVYAKQFGSMRDAEAGTPAGAAAATAVPRRSGAADADGETGSQPTRPALTGGQALSPAAARAALHDEPAPSLAELALSLGVALTLRYIVPRALTRLSVYVQKRARLAAQAAHRDHAVGRR